MLCPLCRRAMRVVETRGNGRIKCREYFCQDHGRFVSGEKILNDQVRGHRWLRRLERAYRRKKPRARKKGARDGE